MSGSSVSGAASASIERREHVISALAADPRLGEWTRQGGDAGYLELARGPVIVILAWPEVWRDPARLAPHLTRARSGNYTLILVGRADELADAPADELLGSPVRMTVLTVPTSPAALAIALNARGDDDRRTLELADLELALERAHYENEMLIDVGRQLSRQRDLGALFGMILRRAREVTGADAGSVYIVEGGDPDVPDAAPRRLNFIESQNDSIAVESQGFTMPVSPSSIVGACVLAKEPISIPDLYRLDPPGTGNNPWGFVHDRTFDQRHGYQ
ncbi:MAG TPA: hypothetical protein VNO33_14835, partial [Kofleriaceae bacterium]|nr:hypothetical protein [Kofleriaceae bacterium]